MHGKLTSDLMCLMHVCSNEREISIRVGDEVAADVTADITQSGGWLRGCNLRTGEWGWFPG